MSTVTRDSSGPGDSCQQSTRQPYSLVCPHCQRVYTDKSRSHYEKHVIFCQLEKPFHCDKCDAQFLQAAVLKRHQRTHTKQVGGRCPICGKTCSSRFRLREHISTHDSPEVREKERFKCTQCDKSFLFKASLRKHYHTHIDELMYKCTGCLQEFSKYHILYRHRKGCEQFINLSNYDRNKKTEKVDNKITKNVFQHKCQLCEESFSARESLGKHVDTVHDPFAIPDQNQHSVFDRSKLSIIKYGVAVQENIKTITMRKLRRQENQLLMKKHFSKNKRKFMQLHSQRVGKLYHNVRRANFLSMKNSLLKAKLVLQQKARFDLEKTYRYMAKSKSAHQTSAQHSMTEKVIRPRYYYQCAWCSVVAPYVKFTHHINMCHRDKVRSVSCTIYIFLYQRQLVHCASCLLSFDSIYAFKRHFKTRNGCAEKLKNSNDIMGVTVGEARKASDNSIPIAPMSYITSEIHTYFNDECDVFQQPAADNEDLGFGCFNAEFCCSYCKLTSASDIIIENHIKSIHLPEFAHRVQNLNMPEHVVLKNSERPQLRERKRCSKKDKKIACVESPCVENNMSSGNIQQRKPLRQKDNSVNNDDHDIHEKANVDHKQKHLSSSENLKHEERRMSKRRIKIKVDKDFDYSTSRKQQKTIIDSYKQTEFSDTVIDSISHIVDDDCKPCNNTAVLKNNILKTEISKVLAPSVFRSTELKKPCKSNRKDMDEVNDNVIPHTEGLHTDENKPSNNSNSVKNISIKRSKTGRLITVKTHTDFQYTNHTKPHKSVATKQKLANGKNIVTAFGSSSEKVSDSEKNKNIENTIRGKIGSQATEDGNIKETVVTTDVASDVDEHFESTSNENFGNASKISETTRDCNESQNCEMENNPMNRINIIQLVCPHCKYMCQTMNVLKDHIGIVHKDVEVNDIVLDDIVTLTNAGNKHKYFFPCLKCLTAFPKREELDKHSIEKHSALVPMGTCSNKSETAGDKLKQVIESRSCTKDLEVEMPHTCKKKNKMRSKKQKSNLNCSEDFLDSANDANKGDTPRYQCTTPGCESSRVFCHKVPLRQHKKIEHKQRLIYSCSLCNSQYADYSVYKTHVRLTHSQRQYVKLELVETRIFCEKLDEDFYLDVCTACGKILSSNRSAEYEHKCVPSQIKYFCPYCKHITCDYSKVKEHIAESHPDLPRSSTGNGNGKEVKKHMKLKFQHVIPDAERQLDPTDGEKVTELATPTDTEGSVCKLCGRTFSTVKEMLSHTSVHTGIRPFACGLCGFSYTRQSAVLKHMVTHRVDSLLICQFCSKGFVDKVDLRTHERTHTGDRPYHCDVCDNSYCAKKSVRKHMQLKHPTEYKTRFPQRIRNDGGQRQCEQCGMVVWSHNLTHHYEKKHSPLHVCAECGEKFKKERQLNRHKSQQHSDCKPVVEQLKMMSNKHPGLLGASSDSKTSKVQFSLDKYKVKDEHKSDKPWKCTLCGERFRLNKFVNLHLRRIHTLEVDKTFSCPSCKRGFPLLTELRVHLRSHTNYRPYKCRLCKKSFKQIGHINDHMRTHTNKHVTSCRICGQRFKMAGNLAPHLRSHCKLRPYKCILCDEDFIDLRRLITHSGKCLAERNNINETRTCHMCHQEFSSAELACNHLIYHKTDRPFVCKKCPESFHLYTQLYKHKLNTEHFTSDDLVKKAVPNRVMLNANNHHDMDLEVLLKQYDYMPVDNLEYDEKVSSLSGIFSRSNDPFMAQIVLEPQTLPAARCIIERYIDKLPGKDEENNLILIAQQLTHVGDNEHLTYTDVCTSTDTAYTRQTNDLEKREIHPEQLASLWETEVVVTGSGQQFPAYERDIQPEISAQGDHIVVTTQHSYDITEESGFDQCESIDELSPVIGYTEQPMVHSSDMKQISLKQTNIEAIGQGHLYERQPKYVLLNEEDKFHNNVDQNMMNNLFIQTSHEDHDFAENVLEGSNQDKPLTTSDAIPYIHTKPVEVNIKSEEGMQDPASEISKNQLCDTPNLGEDLQREFRSTYKVIDPSGNEVLVCVLNEDNTLDDGVDEEVSGSLFHNDGLVIQSTQPVPEPDTQANNTETFVTQPQIMSNRHENSTSQTSSVACNQTITTVQASSESATRGEFSIESKVWGNINDTGLTLVVEPGRENFKVNTKYYNRKQTELSHPFKCPDCPKRFKVIKFMNNHRKIHLSDADRKHQCGECGKGFTCMTLLKNHEFIHLGMKPFKCDKCPKSFRQRGHLMTHLRVHENYRPFQCDVCENCYTTNSQLKKHYLRHTRSDAFEHKCETCHQVFQEHRNLQRHRLTVHLDEKDRAEILKKSNKLEQDLIISNPDKYKPEGQMCDLCGKSFNRTDLLQQHLMRHEAVKTVQCPKCNKMFGSRFLMTEHMRCHQKTSIQCEVCGQMYRGKQLLARHMKMQHLCDGKGIKLSPMEEFECSNCNMKLANKNKFLFHVSACFSDVIEEKISNTL